VGDAYDVGRLDAAKQTHLDEDIFPQQCPYGWNDIMERPIEWPGHVE
jgi:hypothetical protein